MDVILKTAATPADLEAINALARTDLTAEEVYTFAVRLCDNEVDRDFERFPRASLEALAKLFVGKSGIFDHQWSAKGQTARLYKAEVVDEPGESAGEGACWLKGYAYMVRTEANRDLIAEIEGGIKKEISVGCAVGGTACSICGAPAGRCGHRKGEVYDGQLCFFNLEEPTDAYEWSFVAVPAQRKAGVLKGLGPGGLDEEVLAGRIADRVLAGLKPRQEAASEVIRTGKARLALEHQRYGGI